MIDLYPNNSLNYPHSPDWLKIVCVCVCVHDVHGVGTEGGGGTGNSKGLFSIVLFPDIRLSGIWKAMISSVKEAG